MKRLFKSLAPAALMLAVPTAGFAQETDGPPAPPPVDTAAAETTAPQDSAPQDEKKSDARKEIVRVLQDNVDLLADEVEIIASEVEVGQPLELLARNNYWIGVVCEGCDEEVRQELKLKDQGLVIRQVVDDSPAAEAGLQVEDILVSLGDAQLTSVESLSDAIAGSDGESVYVGVIRDGQDIKLELKPAKRQVLHVDNNLRLHHHLLQSGADDHDVILHTIKEKPGQSFSFQVVRPGVITGADGAEVLKLVSPGEVEVIELEGKIKAAIQGGDHDVLLHVDGDKVHERVLHGVLHGQHDGDSASDAHHEDHDVKIEFTHKDGQDSHYVIVVDGKKYEVKGDNFDELPEKVREHVKFLKDGKLMFENGGNLFQRLRLHKHEDGDHEAHEEHAHEEHGDAHEEHIIRRSFSYNVTGEDDGDEDGVRIQLRVEKQDDQPAKIVVKKGDNTWTVDENSLDELPEEVRGKIKVWQSQDGGVFRIRGAQGDDKNVFELKQGGNGVFRVFGNKGEFKFEPKGEFKFEMPKMQDGEKNFGGRFEFKDGNFGRLRLAPGSRYFLAPGSDDDDSSDADLAAKIDALNKEIRALRKAIQKLSDEIDD